MTFAAISNKRENCADKTRERPAPRVPNSEEKQRRPAPIRHTESAVALAVFCGVTTDVTPVRKRGKPAQREACKALAQNKGDLVYNSKITGLTYSDQAIVCVCFNC